MSVARASNKDESPPQEPLIDTGSGDSIVKRFKGRPATLRKLYTALQENIVMHLDAIRVARSQRSLAVTAALHGLKGAAGMYGARRLQQEADSIESALLGGASMESVRGAFDQLEITGRLTVGSVHELLESLAASGDAARA